MSPKLHSLLKNILLGAAIICGSLFCLASGLAFAGGWVGQYENEVTALFFASAIGGVVFSQGFFVLHYWIKPKP